MRNTTNLILNLIEEHTIQCHLTDEQDKQLFHLLHATASRLENQIDTISNFDTAVAALDMFSKLINSYCINSHHECCIIMRKDNTSLDPTSYNPANTNLIILDLTNPKRATLFLCNMDTSLITDDFDSDMARMATDTLTSKYMFNLNRPNERLLASAVLINMCEHTHDAKWETAIKPRTQVTQ